MADYGTRKTDEAVKRAERRLRRVYKEAQRDIGEKLKAWQEAHRAREAKYRQKVADGKMSQADFDAWMRGQVFQGKQWAARKAEIDNVLLNADKAAAKIVNEGKVGVFADNANYIGYGLEHDLRIDSGFTLYDKSTVARLIQDDPQILPMPAPGVVKDKAFPYYNKLMSSAITQGIIQGETIPQITQRIIDKTGESSYKSAVRNARTAYTGAQNAGRIEGLHQAQSLGIEVKKKWLATLDYRTRDTHRDLDGQVRDVDEPFQVDGDEIKYPGDPSAKPALVYNCRCTLIYEYPEYPSSMERLDNITREKIGDMTYREWEEMKRGEEVESIDIPEPTSRTTVDGTDISTTWERRPDKFDFEINDVIDAQGFDGNPRVVDADEFDRAVKESKFIAQRTYSAPDKETLDAYREQLYNGQWYVDCSTGGAQYGQGMYCAADYNGQLTDGIKAEMQHYRDQYMARFGYDLTPEQWLENSSAVLQKYGLDSSQYGEIARAYLNEDDKLFERLTHQLSASERDKLYDELYEVPHRGIHNYVETFTLDPSAKIVSWREINDIRTGTLGIEYRNEVLEEELKRRGLSGDELTFARYNAGLGVSWNDVDAAARRLGEEKRNAVMEQLEDAGNITQRRFNEEQERLRERARIYQEKYHDIGSLAAALGYDAINAENHGQSGSYTVILNRTKVIFRRP